MRWISRVFLLLIVFSITSITVMAQGCIPGSSSSCGYTDVGSCEFGIKYCTLQEVWSDCYGDVGPSEEICDSIDNDCDGEVDEGCECLICAMDECGTDVGVCEKGYKLCNAGFWTECYGEVTGNEEICDGLDNDCDGSIDEGCGECDNGDSQLCGYSDVGKCEFGVIVCENNEWGECMGYVNPVEEICDELDNDCDGDVDEEDVCFGGPITAKIIATPISGVKPLYVNLEGIGTGHGELTYTWNYGDGSNLGYGKNVYHTYNNKGYYTVVLTVMDELGRTATDTETIEVTYIPSAAIPRERLRILSLMNTNEGHINPDGLAEFYISLENTGRELEDVRVMATIHELGVVHVADVFDLDDERKFRFGVDIPPYAWPGLYEVRFSISNDEIRRNVYRDIVVS